MKRHLNIIFIGLLSVFFTCATIDAAELSISASKANLNIDETIQLRLRIEGDSPQTRPDFTKLTESFEILSRSQSHQMTYINGQRSQSIEINLRLAPKKVGTFRIPPIQWGNYQSPALNFTVKELPVEVMSTPSANQTTKKTQAEAEQVKPVFMTVELTPVEPYVDSQILFKVKLHTSIPLHAGQLSDPSSKDAWIYPETAEKRYEVIEKGKIYNVYERSYAIFPKESGPIVIRAPKFVGQPIEALFASRHHLGNLGHSREITLTHPSKQITVKPKQSQDNEPWLPAEDISLNDHWSQEKNNLNVGEPIERTVSIHARGLTLTQLPHFDWQSLPGMKIYPGKVTSNQHFDGQSVTSHKTQTITYIPTDNGEVEIPAMRLPWFDVQSGTRKIASLKGEKLTVMGVSKPSSLVSSMELPSTNQDSSKQMSSPSLSSNTNEIVNSKVGLSRQPLWSSIFILIVSGALLGSVLLRKKENIKTKSTNSQIFTSTANVSAQDIKTACIKSNPQQARRFLNEWLSLNNSKISEETRQTLQSEISQLNNLLYHNQSSSRHTTWDGKRCWKVIQKVLR